VLNRQFVRGLRILLMSVVLLLGGVGVATANADTPVTALAGAHLHKQDTNLCLVARVGPGERPVEQTPCGGFSDQNWDIRPVLHNGELVGQIHNLDRDMCIVTRGFGETPAVVTACNSAFADQLWRGIHFTDNTWRYVNVNSGLCLVARGTSQATQTACNGFTDQFWFLD
jgi:ricin-type beta-trefoil lectin protein